MDKHQEVCIGSRRVLLAVKAREMGRRSWRNRVLRSPHRWLVHFHINQYSKSYISRIFTTENMLVLTRGHRGTKLKETFREKLNLS